MSLGHSTSRTYSRKTSAFQVKQRRRNTQSTSRIPKTPTPQRQTNSFQNSQVEQHRHQSLSASRHGNCSQFRKGLSYLQLCCSPSISSAMTLLRLDSGTCKGAAHIRKHRKLWHCKGISTTWQSRILQRHATALARMTVQSRLMSTALSCQVNNTWRGRPDAGGFRRPALARPRLPICCRCTCSRSFVIKHSFVALIQTAYESLQSAC